MAAKHRAPFYLSTLHPHGRPRRHNLRFGVHWNDEVLARLVAKQNLAHEILEYKASSEPDILKIVEAEDACREAGCTRSEIIAVWRAK